MNLPKEKVDRKEQVEKLELGFIQLSGATDGMSKQEARARARGAAGPSEGPQCLSRVLSQESTSRYMRARGQGQTRGMRRRKPAGWPKRSRR